MLPKVILPESSATGRAGTTGSSPRTEPSGGPVPCLHSHHLLYFLRKSWCQCQSLRLSSFYLWAKMGLWEGEQLAEGCAWWGQYLNLALTDSHASTPHHGTMLWKCSRAGQTWGLNRHKIKPRSPNNRPVCTHRPSIPPSCHPQQPLHTEHHCHSASSGSSSCLSPLIQGSCCSWKLELVPLFRWCELLLVLRGLWLVQSVTARQDPVLVAWALFAMETDPLS